MKQATIVTMFAAFLLSAAQAEAQAPSDLNLQFDDPATAQCVAQCIDGTSACLQPPAPTVPPTAPSKVTKRRPRRPRVHRPSCCEILRAEVTRLNSRVTELSRQVGLLAGRDPTPELNRLKGRFDRLEQALPGLARQGDVDQLRRDLNSLKDQVALLLRNESPIRLSPVVGFLGMYSLDGSSYTTAAAGLRLETSITASVAIGFDALALVSGGDRPFGTQARGFLAYDFSPRWSAELGFSGTWGGYNAQAEAQSLFVSGDLGVTARVYRGLWLNGRVLLGAELDKGSPDFALGGMLTAGYEFY